MVGWPWFKGMRDNRYITQYVITGMGRLNNLGSLSLRDNNQLWNSINRAVKYLDARIREDYEYLLSHDIKLDQNNLNHNQIQYLYARSFFQDISFSKGENEAFKYYLDQAKKYWLKNNKYGQGMIALALKRNGEQKTAQDIMLSLKETSTTHEELGMYWKQNQAGYYWHEAPIETQALLVEAFKEVTEDKKSVDEMRIWLLKQKQTQDWNTTKATGDACYALLLEGTEWLNNSELATINVGGTMLDPFALEDTKVEAGTGYFKTSWGNANVTTDLAKVTVSKTDEGIGWGAMYWQYFEQLDKITPHETPLKLKKKLFLQQPGETGPVITPVADNTKLQPGDLLVVRIELRVDRAMEFVHMKDMRASGLEPVNVLSQYKWQDGLGYYESTRDARY